MLVPMLSYAFKRVIRSWKLFAALLLGTVLASTFFAGINIGADTAAKQDLEQRLSQVPVDIVVSSGGGWYYEEKPGVTVSQTALGMLSSANATEIANLASEVEGITDAEVISRFGYERAQLPNGDYIFFTLAGISNNSRVYDGLTVINGRSSLQENETYVWIGSKDAGKIEVDDVLTMNYTITVEIPRNWTEKPVTLNVILNFTVAGFVELGDEALRIVAGQYYYYGLYPGLGLTSIREAQEIYIGADNLLIASWNKTFAGLLDFLYGLSTPYSPVTTEVLAYIDRESMIDPWDVSGSISNIETVTDRVENKLSAQGFYNMYVSNHLVNVLNYYQFTAFSMRLSFIFISLPVFFVAWYVGTTVSDVSLNLRRREIGLLLTKGFSRGQLLRMLLSEAVLIGLIGGLIGLALSFLLNPLFIMASGGEFFGAPIIGLGTITLVVIFSVVITFLSVFMPARRASSLPAVDALREYRYVEEIKPYKQRLPWIAFILGTYKIIVLLLGINFNAVMMNIGFAPRNFIIVLLLGIWVFIDGILTYVGPLLFFWGFTKIFIRGSLKFQQLTAKAVKFLGDLGSLATKNVQRNPARTASVAFLIALIMWYSFWAVGTLSSQQDYDTRGIYFNVGADISVSLSTAVNASIIEDKIGNLSDVKSTVVEYSFWGESSLGSMNLKAVDPEKWPATAYYEDKWFSGNDVTTAFQAMMVDNNTIILELGTAKHLDLDVGDTVALTFGESKETYNLRVVGFFGSEQSQTSTYTPLQDISYFGRTYWSYVPEGFYKKLNDSIYASAEVLVNLKSGADGEVVAEQIRGLESDEILWVSSVAEQLQMQQSSAIFGGVTNVQRLGVVFAILAASVGTALVTFVCLKERSKEASLMSVRGLSFKQLAVTLLTENLAVVVFAVLLGTVVGLITVRGQVAAQNAFGVSLVTYRMVFPLDSLLTLVTCFILIFASTIIPVIAMARRYVSKLERMVREA